MGVQGKTACKSIIFSTKVRTVGKEMLAHQSAEVFSFHFSAVCGYPERHLPADMIVSFPDTFWKSWIGNWFSFVPLHHGVHSRNAKRHRKKWTFWMLWNLNRSTELVLWKSTTLDCRQSAKLFKMRSHFAWMCSATLTSPESAIATRPVS